MRKKKIEAGDVFATNEGGNVEVVEYVNAHNVMVKHNDEHGHIASVQATHLRNGNVKNPYYPSVLGKGYVGVGGYKVWVGGKGSPEYVAWRGMLERCYDLKWQEKYPTYVGCTVVGEWLNFQVFAEWYSRQYRGDGWQLDKDLVVRGNKAYGPETAVFIPRDLNTLLLSCAASRGGLPIGVCKVRGRYQASVRIGGKLQYLGHYNTPSEAFYAYKEVKEAHIKVRANHYKVTLDPRVYQALMTYEVNLGD